MFPLSDSEETMTSTPNKPALPPVTGAHHAAFRCRNAEETRTFYEDTLGFPMVQALDIAEHPTTGVALHACVFRYRRPRWWRAQLHCLFQVLVIQIV